MTMGGLLPGHDVLCAAMVDRFLGTGSTAIA
jgi:hypothetical protein